MATLRTIATTLSLGTILALTSCSSSETAANGPSTTFLTAAETGPAPTGPVATEAPTTQAPTTTTTAAPTTTTMPTLASIAPFEPSQSEVLVERKRLGGQFAQALLTYDSDATIDSHVQALQTQFDIMATDGLVDLVAEAMTVQSQSVGTVRYVQMGGNRLTRASLMVWVDVERLSPAGELSSESRVVDVRVERVNDVWRIGRLASAGGPAVERPEDLSELAAAVVDDSRISMPDSARWDIYSGHTTPAMLERMVEVADITDYAVLVLSRGHPYRVFATESVSRHSVGQAMDVYEVGGQPVVDSRFEGSPTWNLAKTLFDEGIRSIGSPWAFDGFGGRSFTDDVHQDHLHITS